MPAVTALEASPAPGPNRDDPRAPLGPSGSDSSRRPRSALIRGRPRHRRTLPLLLWALLASALGSGCASEPTGPDFRWAPEPPPNRGRVYVYRSDPRSTLSVVRVRLDGIAVGELRDGEYETIELAAGRHRLRVGMRSYSFLAWGWNEHEFQLEPGETVFLKIAVRLEDQGRGLTPPPRELEIGGRPEGYASKNVFILRSPRAEAQEELVEMKRLAPER